MAMEHSLAPALSALGLDLSAEAHTQLLDLAALVETWGSIFHAGPPNRVPHVR